MQLIQHAQLCLTLWDPRECSLPCSSVHGILQKSILAWVVIPFYKGSSWSRDRTWVSCTADRFFTIWATVQLNSVQSLSRVWLFVTPWIAALQASLSITNSRSSLKLTSIESVMPSSHLILCNSPSPPAHNPSQQQSLFQWVNSSNEVAKVLESQL